AAAALAIDAALARCLPADRDRDVAARYRPMAVADARACLAPLSLDAVFAATHTAMPARVSIVAPLLHAGVADLLRTRSVADWQAWLRVRCIDRAAPLLDADLRRRHQRFYGRALRGERRAAPVWKQVLAAIDRDLGEAMAECYVARHVAADTRSVVQALFERLRAALRARVLRADWLSDTGRARALAKVDTLRASLVAPTAWPDWRELLLTQGSFHRRLRAARAYALRQRLRGLTAAAAAAWTMPAHRVNARYDPHRNRIEVPAGILQSPLFDVHDTLARQYGAIGAVMAHEMSHALDDQGRLFDGDGRFGAAWPPSDDAAFAARAQRIVARFDGLPLIDGIALDGRLTLGENIADLAGLAIAWDAWQTAQDDDGALRQRDARDFFFAWARLWRQALTPDAARQRARFDHHAPAALRANVAAMALPAFDAAFAVQGSRDPGERLGVW
ncbi:MAG: M13-type metalloendopeptidase, partial [Luteimonas sp.]